MWIRVSLGLVAFVVALAVPASALASASGVVVSEFRFRGPAGGNDEFVELLNTSTAPVDISGWKLEGCAGASGAASTRATVAAGVVLPAGGRYLFVNSLGGALTGDATYGTGIADDGGVRISTAAAAVVDGVGSASGAVDVCREGAGLTIPTANGDNGFERLDSGRQDTDVNTADFAGPKASDPQGASAPPAPVDYAIRAVQGPGHVSPLLGVRVRVSGIVTAKRGNGFYLQDPTPDSSIGTSEGIFVFGSTASGLVAIGDSARVTGTVTEFRGATDNLSVTELTAPAVEVISTGNAIPAATVIGLGGRVPPLQVIDDDVLGDVETSGTFDPTTDGIDFYESLEGMLVQVDSAVVVGARNRFGEVVVVGDGGAGASVPTNRGGIVIRPNDFNPERILIDDEILRPLTSTPLVDVADRFAAPLVGPLDYSFDNFKVQVTSVPVEVDGGLQRETTVAPRDQELAVATFNVENLDPSDGASFDRLALLIVSNLRAPDVIGIEEAQDDTGAMNDGVVSATQTWSLLIDAITRAGGPQYFYTQIDPVDGADGGQPGGNIRVGFLYRTDRGLSFKAQLGGDATTPVTVVEAPSGVKLSFNPGRIDPANPAWLDSRKPLVGQFKFRGKDVFIVVTHFASKGADQPLFGRFQPPARSSEVQRHAQAAVVNSFVDDLLRSDAAAKVVVLGDINDFEFSQTVEILSGGALTSLVTTLPEGERYSYVFEGNSQTLDQILVTSWLFGRLVAYDVVHVNSEFADQASDHDPSVARFVMTGR